MNPAEEVRTDGETGRKRDGPRDGGKHRVEIAVENHQIAAASRPGEERALLTRAQLLPFPRGDQHGAQRGVSQPVGWQTRRLEQKVQGRSGCGSRSWRREYHA